MKVRMDAKSLLAAIKSARAFTDQRATTNALRCVRVDAAKDGGVLVCGNSIECAARFAIRAEVAPNGSGAACFLPGEVATMLKGGDGMALLDAGDQSATLGLGLASLKIETMPVADFAPILDQPDGSAFCTVEAGALARALAATIPVAGGVLDRVALQAVHFEIPAIEGRRVNLVATDGRRLHVARVDAADVSVPKDAEGPAVSSDLPIGPARKLAKLLAKRGDAKVRIAAHAKRFHAGVVGSFQFYAKANATPFPAWRLSIPDGDLESDGVFAVPSRAILAALARFAGMGFGDVRLDFTARGIDLSSSTRRKEDAPVVSLRQVVPAAGAEAMGEPIMFNPALLADAIAACGATDVIFCRREGYIVPLRAPSFGGAVTAYVMALHE